MNTRTFDRAQAAWDNAMPDPDHLVCTVCGECADKYGSHPELDVAWCSEECQAKWQEEQNNG